MSADVLRSICFNRRRNVASGSTINKTDSPLGRATADFFDRAPTRLTDPFFV
jgi:hypothetical protein